MLAVNVAFLSIPGVMRQEDILPSSSQIASTLSVEASIGSLLTGLFLLRHNRTKQELDPTEAVSG